MLYRVQGLGLMYEVGLFTVFVSVYRVPKEY